MRKNWIRPLATLMTVALSAPTAAVLGAEIPALDLSRVDPAVRAQLEQQRQTVDDLLGPSIPSPELADELLRLGRLYLAYDYLLHGVATLEAAAEHRPESFEIAYLLGYGYQRRGRLDAALTSFDRCLELRPGNAVTQLRAANLLLDDRQPEAASQLFESAHANDESCIGALFGLGEVARRGGDDEAAEDYFRQALERSPEAAQLRYTLGLTLRRLGRTEEAQAELSKAQWQKLTLGGWLGCPDPLVEQLAHLTTGAPAHLLRGARAQIRGNASVEASEFARAVAANPEDDVARSNLGAALYRQGDLQAASDHYTEALRLAPGNATYHYDLGQIQQRLGNQERAEALFRRASELNPQFKEAHLKLAAIDAESGDFAGVVEHCRRVIAVDPLHRTARTQLANALFRLGRRDEGLAALGELIDVDPPADLAARLQMASQLATMGDLDRSLRHFRDIAAISEDAELRALAHSRAGQILLQKGELGDAIDNLRIAVELDVDLAEAQGALRHALSLQRDRE